MATIRQRAAGAWEVQIRKTGFPTCSRTFDSKAEARAWATHIESEMERGVFHDRSEAEKTTLGEIIRRYLRDVSPGKKGAESEQYRLGAILRDDPIADIKMAALSGKLMAAWRDKRLQNVSGSTTNRDLALLSAVINWARREQDIHIENPISSIRRPPESRGRTRRLTAGEEEKLLAALVTPPTGIRGRLTDPRNRWMHSLVVFAIETAMRRSEILRLTWKDVHIEQRYVHLVDSKNGETRDVPLSTRAVSILQALQKHESGHVFPISADSVKKSFNRAAIRAGLENLRFHDLRHEATSRLAQKLSNVLELSSVTGHKNLGMLKRYYHPRAWDLAKKLD